MREVICYLRMPDVKVVVLRNNIVEHFINVNFQVLHVDLLLRLLPNMRMVRIWSVEPAMLSDVLRFACAQPNFVGGHVIVDLDVFADYAAEIAHGIHGWRWRTNQR